VLELMDSIETAKRSVGDATQQAREKLPIERLRPQAKPRRSKLKVVATIAVVAAVVLVVSRLVRGARAEGDAQAQAGSDPAVRREGALAS
jgi:ferric-dicitrate binding protein FerR (iron transport regulator)